MYVEGVARETAACSISDGSYAFYTQPQAGQVYGVAMTATGATRGLTIGKATTTGAVSGFNVRTGFTSVTGPAAISTSELAQFTTDRAASLTITAPTASPVSYVQNEPGEVLEVTSGATLTADVEMRTDTLRITAGGTYNGGAVATRLLGGGTGACAAAVPARSYCNAGTMNAQTGTFVFQPFTATTIAVPGGASAYNALLLNPINAGQSITMQLGTADAPNLTAASLTLDASSVASLTANTTAAVNPAITVTGATSVGAAATLGGSGSGTTTLGGSVTGDGNISFTAGTVELRNAGSAQNINASGTLPGSPWQFATLIASTSSGARTVTVPATSREVRASTLLQVGKASDGAVTTLDASASTRPITVTGDLAVSSKGSYIADAATEVRGNFTNSGSVTAGTGTFYMRGTATSTLTMTGTGSLYNVVMDTPGKSVQLATALVVTNALTISGSSCTTPIALISSSSGTQRTITNTGATMSMSYASIQDIQLTTGATAVNSGDLGNNTNITFPAGAACGTVGTLYTDSTNAAAGSTQPTAIDGRSAFHMSFVNSTSATVDRYRTSIESSKLTSSVKALFPLDGTGSDRSTTANNSTPTGGTSWVTGATNFSQAASFNGTTGYLSAPNNASYNSSTYTVDFWMKASGYGSSVAPTMVDRAVSNQYQFKVGLDTPTRALTGIVTSNGGTIAY